MKTHGRHNSPEYGAWEHMKSRCLNPNNPNFKYYGGRGISICDKWLNFDGFFEDIGERPSKNHSLDRIDNDGHYRKENCRWATKKQQLRNTRHVIPIKIGDETKSVGEWAETSGVDKGTILYRVKNGFPENMILSKPFSHFSNRQAKH